METMRKMAVKSDGSDAACAPLIATIGRIGFDDTLSHYLNQRCGGHHLAIFRLNGEIPQLLTSLSADRSGELQHHASQYVDGKYWRSDPLMMMARKCAEQAAPMILRLDLDQTPSSDELTETIYRPMGIREHVILCGDAPGGLIGITLLRTHKHGLLGERQITALGAHAKPLFAAIAKHSEMTSEARRLTAALRSIDTIEYCCSQASEKLPWREIQVCARTLYGLSTTGTALDLKIGEETVQTYRKRIYQRLSISGYRELLLWYIRLWSGIPPAEDGAVLSRSDTH